MIKILVITFSILFLFVVSVVFYECLEKTPCFTDVLNTSCPKCDESFKSARLEYCSNNHIHVYCSKCGFTVKALPLDKCHQNE